MTGTPFIYGRAARSHAPDRVEARARQAFDGERTMGGAQPARLTATILTAEAARAVISRNYRRGFDRSIHPGLGCTHGQDMRS